jgi:hypothetical protein
MVRGGQDPTARRPHPCGRDPAFAGGVRLLVEPQQSDGPSTSERYSMTILRISQATVREDKCDEFLQALRQLVRDFPARYDGLERHELTIYRADRTLVSYMSWWRRRGVGGCDSDVLRRESQPRRHRPAEPAHRCRLLRGPPRPDLPLATSTGRAPGPPRPVHRKDGTASVVSLECQNLRKRGSEAVWCRTEEPSSARGTLAGCKRRTCSSRATSRRIRPRWRSRSRPWPG